MQRPLIPIVALMSIWLLTFSEQVPTPDDPFKSEVVNSDQEESSEQMAKRSWNQMHGAWGKRSDQVEDLRDAIKDLTREWSRVTSQHQAAPKRNWNKLQGAWGKRSDAPVDTDAPAADQFYVNHQPDRYLWTAARGAWDKRPYAANVVPYFNDELDQSLTVDPMTKRSWNQLHGSWGKRLVPTPQMQPGRDHWNDKRAWNELHGGWGKRDQSEQLTDDYVLSVKGTDNNNKRDWSNLRGSWGKRELLSAANQPIQGNEWTRKRESGWNNLKGLWG